MGKFKNENTIKVIRDKKALKKLYDSCDSMREVAEKLECGETVVHKWIHKFGITPKPRLMTQKGCKKHSVENRKRLSEWAKTRTGEKNPNWRNGATPYGLLIRGRKWRERRRTILARDNYECVECGSDLDLHVHHIRPVSKYPELVNDWNNLITMCAVCHRRLHFSKENLANSVNSRTDNAELSSNTPFFLKIDYGCWINV